MAMFGGKKAKPSEGSELVLAYLEDAQRVRATLFVIDPKGREVAASLVAVTEERVTLSLQGSVMADKGQPVALLLYLDGLRFKARGRLLELKPGSLVMELPGSIDLAERRRKPRARLNQREGATAIALTGLFDGIGLTGAIENISETGFCLKVDRAMNVKTQARMNLGSNLIPVGESFMLIKLNKLPKCPPIELGGSVVHVVSEGNGLSVGIAFEPGKEGLLAPVRALVASRAGNIPSNVPPKARRAQEPEAAPLESAAELVVPRSPTKKDPEPPSPPPVPAPQVVAPAPIEPVEAPHPEPPSRGSALLRVKKRTRGILLAMPEGPDRDALATYLSEDGYGRVRVAATLSDLLACVDEAQLIFVDGGLTELQDLALASLLRHRLGEEMPPVILAEDSVDADLVLGAQELGVAQVLVKPYGLDADLLRMIEEHLGIA